MLPPRTGSTRLFDDGRSLVAVCYVSRTALQWRQTFLERAYPGCAATLQTRPRPIIPDYRLAVGAGYASVSGRPGSFLGAGLRLGIPLDRLRRWEFVLGPQINYLSASGNQSSRNAFLLGARLGLEWSTGEAGRGFTAGPFGEVGHGWFSSTDYASGGAGSRRETAAYGELGLGAGYRTPSLGGSTRFDFVSRVLLELPWVLLASLVPLGVISRVILHAATGSVLDCLRARSFNLGNPRTPPGPCRHRRWFRPD